jgi:hypothetical protein
MEMIGTDILYDFPKHEGYTHLNFIVHEVDWAVIAYTGEDENGEPYGKGTPQWRIAYVEDPNLPGDKEVLWRGLMKESRHISSPETEKMEKEPSQSREPSRMLTTSGWLLRDVRDECS